MRFLVTRPLRDAETTANRLKEMGHDAIISPVMTSICPVVTLPATSSFQGIIITSRNSLYCLQHRGRPNSLVDMRESWLALKKLPVYAVGSASAKLATQFGFAAVHEGPGNAHGLADFISERLAGQENPTLYYPCGRKKAFDLSPPLRKHGIALVEQVVYETVPNHELAPEAINAFRKGHLDGVLLLSPRSARLFVQLLNNNKLAPALSQVSCLCLSQNVAKAASALSWRQILVATHPDMNHLLALIEQVRAR